MFYYFESLRLSTCVLLDDTQHLILLWLCLQILILEENFHPCVKLLIAQIPIERPRNCKCDRNFELMLWRASTWIVSAWHFYTTMYLGNFIFMWPAFGERLKGNERSEVGEAQGFVCLIEFVELRVCSSVNIRDSSGCNSAPQNKQPNDLISLCLHKGSGGQWVCVYGSEREWLRRTIDLAEVGEFSRR